MYQHQSSSSQVQKKRRALRPLSVLSMSSKKIQRHNPRSICRVIGLLVVTLLALSMLCTLPRYLQRFKIPTSTSESPAKRDNEANNDDPENGSVINIDDKFRHCSSDFQQDYYPRPTTIDQNPGTRVSSSSSIGAQSNHQRRLPVWVASYPGSGAELVRELIAGLAKLSSANGADAAIYNNESIKTDEATIDGCMIGKCRHDVNAVTCKTHWPAMNATTLYQDPFLPPGVYHDYIRNNNKYNDSNYHDGSGVDGVFNWKKVKKIKKRGRKRKSAANSLQDVIGIDDDYSKYYDTSTSIVLIRNPRYALPSWYNQIYETRNNLTFHSRQAPYESWKEWSTLKRITSNKISEPPTPVTGSSGSSGNSTQMSLSTPKQNSKYRSKYRYPRQQQHQQLNIASNFDNLQDRIQRWYDLIYYWIVELQQDYKARLVVPYEQLIDSTTGPILLRKLRYELKLNNPTGETNVENSVLCLWWSIVQQRQAMKRSSGSDGSSSSSSSTNKYVPPYTKHHQEFMLDRLSTLIEKVKDIMPDLIPIFESYIVDIQTNLPLLEEDETEDVETGRG